MLKDFLTSQENDIAAAAPVLAEASEPAQAAAAMQNNKTSHGCNFSAVDAFPLAMVYAPMQTFRNLYSPEKALEAGTLFAELDLPFLEKRGTGR